MTLSLIVLAVLQGITEFLPISSSGHFVLAHHFLGITEDSFTLNIVLHMGTLLSILVYFSKRILHALQEGYTWIAHKGPFHGTTFQYGIYAIVGTIPAVTAVLFAGDVFENAFASASHVAWLLSLTGCILFSTIFIKKSPRTETMTLTKALIIGIAQCIALLPGVSRSGTTITCGLWCGLSAERAFLFSFFLAIPAILGAFIFDISGILAASPEELTTALYGFILAALFGYGALFLLERFLKSNKLHWFAWYCWGISGVSLYLLR